MAIIYRVINKKNGRSYVGFTRHTAEQRFNMHWFNSKRSKYPFHRALRKYGRDQFCLEILEESDNEDYLHRDRESFWIGQFENLYNVQLGGEGNTKQCPVYLHGDTTICFDTPVAAAQHLNVDTRKIHQALNRELHGKASGIKDSNKKYWIVSRYISGGRPHKRFELKRKLRDETGMVYESAFDAAEAFGVSHQRIRAAVKTGGTVAGLKISEHL